MRALIVGCMGQDGRYLTEQLTAQGLEVFGISRKGLHFPDGSLDESILLNDQGLPDSVIATWQPERIYYLAAFHQSSEEGGYSEPEVMRQSFAVHYFGLLTILDALLTHSRSSRLFYAASSHVFGLPMQVPQDETTPMDAFCYYGISKALGVQACRLYRRRHRLFCSVGFLYNHESPYRKRTFLSRKIVQAALAIQRQQQNELVLGNLDALVDWGYAPEYTDAMTRILDLDLPGDFVIASGVLHSVQDFVRAVFEYVGLDWRDWVREDASVLKKNAIAGNLVGNSARLKMATGWEPRVHLRQLVEIMVDAERNGME